MQRFSLFNISAMFLDYFQVDKMAAEPAVDEYMLKKQKEVLQESKAMVPDCQRRLQVAVDDLTALLVCSHQTVSLA